MSEEGEDKSFKISWSMTIEAANENEAARKAFDLLKSRQPIALSIQHGKKKPIMVAPKLEEQIISTICHFLPMSEVEVEIYDNGEIEIDVISEMFRSIPNEQDRMDLVYDMFSALPESYKEQMYFSCYTFEEFDEINETDEPDDTKSQGDEMEEGWLSYVGKDERKEVNSRWEDDLELKEQLDAIRNADDQGTSKKVMAIYNDTILSE